MPARIEGTRPRHLFLGYEPLLGLSCGFTIDLLDPVTPRHAFTPKRPLSCPRSLHRQNANTDASADQEVKTGKATTKNKAEGGNRRSERARRTRRTRRTRRPRRRRQKPENNPGSACPSIVASHSFLPSFGVHGPATAETSFWLRQSRGRPSSSPGAGGRPAGPAKRWMARTPVLSNHCSSVQVTVAPLSCLEESVPPPRLEEPRLD